jgi:hypothetical protein
MKLEGECADDKSAVAAEISPRGNAVVFAFDDGHLGVLDAVTGGARCVRNACSTEEDAPGASQSEHPGLGFWERANSAAPPQRDCRDVPCADSVRQRVLWHPDGKTFVTANRARICVWERERLQVRQELTLDARFDWSHDLKFAPDGTKLALARDQSVLLWDFRDGILKEDAGRDEIRGYLRGMQWLEWHPKGRVLATAGSVTAGNRGTGTEPPQHEAIRLWNVANGREVAALAGMSRPIGGLAWSRDGEWLAAHDRTGVWKVWQTTREGIEPTASGSVRGDIAGFAISARGERIAAITADGRLLEHDVSAGKATTVRELKVGPVLGASYGSDGRLLVIGRNSTAIYACGSEELVQVGVRTGGVLSARRLDDGSVGLASTDLTFTRRSLPAQSVACSGAQAPEPRPTASARVVAGRCRRPETSNVRRMQAESEYKRAFPAPGWAAEKEPDPSAAERWSVACFVLHATRDRNYHLMVASVFASPLRAPANLERSERVAWIRTLLSGAERAGVGPEPGYSIHCPERLFRAAEHIASELPAGNPSQEALLAEIESQREKLERERACIAAKWGTGAGFR